MKVDVKVTVLPSFFMSKFSYKEKQLCYLISVQ